MKIAIVCDWLVKYAGEEKVLEQILNVFPEADIFALVDFIESDNRGFIKNKKVNTSFIQNLPKAKIRYRYYLPFMPLAVEQLDVSNYDIVISCSRCVAKGVITAPNQVHISYVYAPVRWAWNFQNQYLKETGLSKRVKSWIVRIILHYMRFWDLSSSNNVDFFIAGSKLIAKRIFKHYRRRADVIYPPVDVETFSFCEQKEDFYLSFSNLVSYKKVDLIVDAFRQMPDKKLLVVGDGPAFAEIRKKAFKNVVMLGYQKFEILKELMQKARACIFAAEEDFGMELVEAQACGTPVIAFGKGGASEIVVGLEKDNSTGVLFNTQSAESIYEAVHEFEKNCDRILPKDCRENAERFSKERFMKRIKEYVLSIL